MITSGIDYAQFYSDVAPFLDRLEQGSIPNFVMTYAEHAGGQYGKISSSPFDGGLMITPDSDKGRYEKTFRYPDGYHLTVAGQPAKTVVASEACLIDDKPASFENWDGPGFCILRGKPLKDELPPNVRAIQTLDELVCFEGKIIHIDDMVAIRTDVGSRAVLDYLKVLPSLNPENSDTQKVHIGEVL
jgi:hypothetical protein